VLSARSAATKEEMSKVLQGRLFALGRAHELVQPGLREAAADACDAPLRSILHDIVAPYAHGNTDQRVTTDGPEIAIKPSAITSLALVLHELATNAAKYGALGDPAGHVSVQWEMLDSVLEFSWRESGGPKIMATPQHTGFGTLLARRSIEGQLGGGIEYDWLPQGLHVRIILPLSKVTHAVNATEPGPTTPFAAGGPGVAPIEANSLGVAT
jgi:two-component system CheB/CheR fusion protein